ncbi:ABC transporter permease [Cupriavidus necator]|uniref:branched-chain amino acid ABC transporter permease n=1 Tax=Cupriavidus necator TaxID=106590 RepID=UPI003F733DA5
MSIWTQLIFAGISVGCIYGLIALGFVIIYKATESVNFAQGDLMMVGAAFTLWLILKGGFPYQAALIVAVTAMFGLGYAIDALVVRRFIGKPRFSIVMLTFGIGAVMRSLAGLAWGYEPLSFPSPYGGKALHMGSAMVAADNVAIVAGTVALCIALYFFFRYAPAGLRIQAASQNQLAAGCVGIDVRRTYSLVWGLAAAIACVAGVLVAPIVLIDPNLGFMGIKAFAAAVIGGFGSLPGALLGGLLVGIIEQVTRSWLPAGWSELAVYGLLMLVLAVRPGGLVGQLHRKKA